MTPDPNLRALWQAGRLRWKLLPQAKRVYDAVRAQWGQAPFLLNCHRNFTKSTLLLALEDEECRRAPRTPCAIVCDTKSHALAIVEEKFAEFAADCPEDLRPKTHITQRGFYFQYPNGSRLWLFGADDHRHIKTLRGLGFRLIGIDEAGHIEGSRGVTLTVIVRSIALPALAKFTRANPDRQGQLVLATTSPMDEVHDFWSLWDNYPDSRFMMPLDVNPDFSDEYKAARARECGGAETVDYRREYGCERISLADAVPLPQVTQARLDGSDGKPALVRAVAQPEGPREWYVSMDIGGRHLTALLWGYYDHPTQTVVIAREWAAANQGTADIAAAVRDAERGLWPNGPPEYLDRWADNNNLILLHDLDKEHELRFYGTRKDEKAAQLSELRREIAEGRVAIDPGCARLILTLRKARWKQTALKTPQWDYSREIGHADLLDALLYLVRNVKRRPYPTVEHTVFDAAGVPFGENLAHLRTPGMRQLAHRLRDDSEMPLQDYDA